MAILLQGLVTDSTNRGIEDSLLGAPAWLLDFKFTFGFNISRNDNIIIVDIIEKIANVLRRVHKNILQLFNICLIYICFFGFIH